MNGEPATAARIGSELAKAGLDVYVYAIDIDSGTRISVGGDELSVAASTGKVPMLVWLMRAADAGDVDLDEMIAIEAGHRTVGASGLSIMTRPCQLALADVAERMISISDNLHRGHHLPVEVPSGDHEQVRPEPREVSLDVVMLGPLKLLESTKLLDTVGATVRLRGVIHAQGDKTMRVVMLSHTPGRVEMMPGQVGDTTPWHGTSEPNLTSKFVQYRRRRSSTQVLGHGVLMVSGSGTRIWARTLCLVPAGRQVRPLA